MWTIAAKQNCKNLNTPYDNRNGEWLIMDADGRPVLGTPGGTFLPSTGEYWHFLHRDEKWSRFQVGDRAQTRDEVPGFWKQGELGRVVRVKGPNPQYPRARSSAVERPISWKRDRDGKVFEMQGWRLWKKVPAAEDKAVDIAGAGASDDISQLPWQIVGINNPAEIQKSVNGFSKYLEQVKASIGSTGQKRGGGAPSSTEQQMQTELFEQALAMLDGSLAGSESEGNTESDSKDRDDKQGGQSVQRAHTQADLAEYNNCRAAGAVVLLERLLARNKSFVWRKGEPQTTSELRDWLIRGHARARRCPGTGSAPAAGEFKVGDRVRFKEQLDGFWDQGSTAKVIGLGRPTVPLALRLEGEPKAAGHNINTQLWRVALVEGEGQSESGSRYPNVRQGSAITLDYYELLRLPPSFTASQLRKAYHAASLRLHPDKGGSKEMFEAAAEGHAVLADARKRELYDEGDDLPRPQEMTLAEEVDRYYYPEKQGYREFGDPRKNFEDRLRRRQEVHRAQREQLRELQLRHDGEL